MSIVRLKDAQIISLERERDRQALILRINNLLVSQLEPEKLFDAVATTLWHESKHDFMAMGLQEADGSAEVVQFVHTTVDFPPPTVKMRLPLSAMPMSIANRTGRVEVVSQDRLHEVPAEVGQIVEKAGISSICYVPLVWRGEILGSLTFGSRDPHHFTPEAVDLLTRLGVQVSIALDNSLAYLQIQMLKDRLKEEKLFLEEEIRQDFATGDMIGSSPAWRQVIAQVDTVAQSDATVLLLGETGTGKEMLARALHERSGRRDRTFVKVNCSAIPMGLMESELFGHEKGAFTGAIQRKLGRFELAHMGTLFLDEIGDLPLELQPKLLRAIQEREFERLGSTKTISVNVRIIAATHRSLEAMVNERTFRQDLFYRLSVFPITVPPLRERKEDIPGLVRFFTQKFALRLDRRIERISTNTMKSLVAWAWPGNIRELQNLIERSVILSQGTELKVPLAGLRSKQAQEGQTQGRTLEDMERLEIQRALKASGGRIGGPNGAAAHLGIKRTTLNARMKKLGILRENGFDDPLPG